LTLPACSMVPSTASAFAPMSSSFLSRPSSHATSLAFALVGALEAQDGQAGNTFAKALAMNMLEIEGELAPDNMTLLASGLRAS
jgi:hypothetical protein